MKFAIILVVLAAAILTGNYSLAGGWAFGVAVGLTLRAFLDHQEKRHKSALEAALTPPWVEVGTIQRTGDGSYELWNGKGWVKV